MKPQFPNKFDLASLSGPRSKAFSERQDAFQQLIGDALQFAAGPGAHVASTKGPDGSIDAWVGTGPDTPSPLQGLPAPIVVECKDHDDTLRNWAENVYGGWSKVRTKLKNASAKGWPDLFVPWERARSYAYCVSAVLHQSARDKLTESIRQFFEELSDDQRPPVEEVRVLDWSDLRPWLSSMPRICDAWLGVGSSGILSHAEYLASLSGFREYMLSSKLPFVSPAADDSTAPDALFRTLAGKPDKPGILLVGAGGVGKTRTSLEVAHLAERAGWRSLHIIPVESEVTSEDLARVVLPGDQPTLLIFDYLDQMQWLDLGALRRSLIPRAEQRGIQIRLFGNSRPGRLRFPTTSRDELFEKVELRPKEQQLTGIIQTMIKVVAPGCLDLFGQDELVRICGQRPIIALLIARELERRLLAGQGTTVELAGLRTGDLLYWLQRRLADDGMKVDVPTSPLEPGRPSAPMVAAAAAFVCAPNPAEALIGAAQAAADTRGEPCDAEHVVTALKSLGWLETEGSWLAAAHDVVADEVFDQVVREGPVIRKADLEAVLSVCSVSAEMVGRLATALKRVVGAIEDEVAAQRFNDSAAHWLERNAVSVGSQLASGDADRTSYALGGILDGIPWCTVATQRWSDLVAPWLTAHGTKAVARHLLYKGLRQDETAPRLVDTGLIWLKQFKDKLDAGFVLTPLLARKDLGDKATEAIDIALGWLKQFKDKLDVGFVLTPLLARKDLGDKATEAIDIALGWLKQFKDKLDVGFVLTPLLARKDLGDKATEAIDIALGWLKLKQFKDKLDAEFVLTPLLARKDLGDKATEAIDIALGWLKLKQFKDKLDAEFVLHSLLAREDLGDKTTEAIDIALSWLKRFKDKLDAGFVLPPLLARKDLGDKEATEAIEIGLGWLKRFEDKLDAGFVLPPLLARKDLGDKAKEAIDCSVVWLGDYVKTKDAEFVLRNVLRRPDVSRPQVLDLKRSGVERLRPRVRDPNDNEASFLLRWCLQSRVHEPELDHEIFELGLAWLEASDKRKDPDYVFNRILPRPDPSEDQWTRAAKHCLRWLRQTPHTAAGRDFPINSMLVLGLPPGVRQIV